MSNEFNVDVQNEVIFPKEIFQNDMSVGGEDEIGDLTQLINSISDRINVVNSNVDSFVQLKIDVEQKQQKLDAAKKLLEEAKFNFEQQMKKERQELEDMKIDFAQEKNRLFHEIELEKEKLEKNSRNFEKHRSEQMILIEQNKKLLTKNYQEFEKVVNRFNQKIDQLYDNN